ncbi:Lipin/Ned1/Smp2-domain-containing protein [Microdochium trichocladiopsis]|uniref:Lipin/Ned1/Smp2-domain-containing protein n=1 Tax=Microdochium trichocladiopsis TaxID=1682393 RepID=A0A9P9BNJ3_9PEZI|nr:Lipin/Ned1/Smp2-domain-containing protein [Microdochium trichocladiopsis]KAH7027803.1 Lipin/Ned1/Smp2-domain-containing protein [Microdochium trichocladiopsis]
MQYVRNISDSVSTAWNSINPATLSGAIDVIVVEHDDGTLACSPFHVRFGKFSLLRPYEKKVEFRVNGEKQEYAMKLGEGGEAFFPPLDPAQPAQNIELSEPDFLQLDNDPIGKPRSATVTVARPGLNALGLENQIANLAQSQITSAELTGGRPPSRALGAVPKHIYYSDNILPTSARAHSDLDRASSDPPPLDEKEALARAEALAEELSAVNIPSHVTSTGDLMLDMTGYKSSEEDAIRAEILARNILSEKLEGDYDIGALFGMDEEGNLWIYRSEDAKDAAMKKTMARLRPAATIAADAASDPGYQSDDSLSSSRGPSHRRSESDAGHNSDTTPPTTPGTAPTAGNPNKNYAKTLRLTSDQLRNLNLKAGENTMSFTVNRATCQANMYLWRHDTPVVISDIDGTITKSDALGHVLYRIGRDWTHAGVAKLYSDIVANGYNIMYLTSRSVGQADTTRTYLAGIVQDGYRLPRGPTILSPDRTVAALRRELYLRKPHVFKMATLRDIKSLYGPVNHCFYAGFGNRLTDQISYRTVDVPRNRIFTINSNAEVSLDLLSLNKMRLTYVSVTEVVDHYFPPVSTLVKGGGEDFTDFKYWRDTPLELDDFSASDSEATTEAEDEEDEDEDDAEDEDVGEMGDSYISRGSEGDVANSMGAAEYDEDDEDDADNEEEDAGPDDEDAEAEEDDDEVDSLEQQVGPPKQSPVATRPTKISTPGPDINAELITGVKNLEITKDA